jgi:hypothetical protein
MSRGRRAEFPSPVVKDEPTPVLPIEPRRFALVIEDGSSLVVDLTAWPGTAFTTEIAPLVRARILRMGPGLIRRSVQRLLLNLRRFWGFLSERGEMPGKLMDLNVEVIDDYENWLERKTGGRIYQRHLLAALIGVLRVGSEDHPDLLPQALLPRLRFLGHGFVGGSIPRDAYGSGIVAALKVAARGQILDARSRIALAEDLPPHPVQIAACPMLSAHRDAVLSEIAVHGRIETRHPAFQRFANLAGRRKLDIGIEVPHRGFHLLPTDLAAFLILLSLETGMEAESLIRLKADCLCNPTKGYVEIAYHKRRARGSEWKRLRVRDGSSATPGGLIRLAIALTERARRHLETDRLWVLWTVTGLRHAAEDGPHGVDAFAARHGLRDDDGKPLRLNLSRLRKTHKAEWYRRTGGQMEQFAVGHSVAVAARHYAEIPALAHIHDAALADAFNDALDAARIVPGPETAATVDARPEEMPGSDGAAARPDPHPQDLWLARCGNFFASPFGAEGKPCPTPFWGCLECRNAVISEAKLPALLAFQSFMADQRSALHAEDWTAKFARAYARITHQILPSFPPQVVDAARALGTAEDGTLLYLPAEATAL